MHNKNASLYSLWNIGKESEMTKLRLTQVEVISDSDGYAIRKLHDETVPCGGTM
jgi:hypothetical protein